MVAIVRLGMLLGLVLLSSCSRHLNMSRIETDIQDDIERQGRRLTLKGVICPSRVAKQAEAYFRCVGELPDGGQFTINVIQQDDQGSVVWDVPSSKVLINLASLEETIQEDIRDVVDRSLVVDCGDTYRINKRGDSFECDVVGAGTVANGRVESVLVKVNGESNLEWQEVVIGVAAAPAAGVPGAAATQPSGTVPAQTPDASTADATPDTSTAASNSSSSEATADEGEDDGAQ